MKTANIVIKRALVSVSDKTDLIALCEKLQSLNVEIISTGGTAEILEENGISVTPIQNVTGNPEVFGGRMKTISFEIESALLYRRGHDQDETDAAKLNIVPIDLVVCNLYPFENVAKQKANEDELIEHVDIGGPTMVRAAAKNYESVCVITDPKQYSIFLNKLTASAEIDFETRREFALQAFQQTAQYDIAIANTLTQRFSVADADIFAGISLKDPTLLRYGENPHQQAHFYQTTNTEGVAFAQADILQGKALSYNNLLDADAAWKSCSDAYHSTEHMHGRSVVSLIKHLNPCGLAVSFDTMTALQFAWAGDPISAFGSILCFSSEVTHAEVEWLSDKFIEIIIAPKFSDAALVLLAKKKNLRVLKTPIKGLNNNEKIIRSISGGVLIQEEDELIDTSFTTVTQMEIDDQQRKLAQFAVQACKHLKSNAICLASESECGTFWLTGAGMGQPNRLDALQYLTIPRFNDKKSAGITIDIEQSILVSDAFFPFKDSIETANQYQIKTIIQPGGSIRDQEVIDECDKFGIAMAMTGNRHFRH